MASHLRVTVSQADDGATVIRCEGEIDYHTVQELREAVAWSMTADLRLLRLDLSEVEFFESSGLSCLLAASADCRERGVPVELISSREVRRLLDLSGLGDATALDLSPATDTHTLLRRRLSA